MCECLGACMALEFCAYAVKLICPTYCIIHNFINILIFSAADNMIAITTTYFVMLIFVTRLIKSFTLCLLSSLGTQ